MVTVIRALIACALAAGSIASCAERAAAHPLHTTLADVQLDRRTGEVRVMVRVFADDLDAAVVRSGALAPVTDAGRGAYVSARLALSIEQSHSVSLQPCGVNRQANLLWICLRGRAGTAGTLSASDALLVDVYADQVNLVQATDGRVKRTVLFTRGDHPKPIL